MHAALIIIIFYLNINKLYISINKVINYKEYNIIYALKKYLNSLKNIISISIIFISKAIFVK